MTREKPCTNHPPLTMPLVLPSRETRIEFAVPPAGLAFDAMPAWAAQLRVQTRVQTGSAICVLNQATPEGLRLHWLEAANARGWIAAASRQAAAMDAQALSPAANEALALGFVGADAILLAFQRQCGELPRLSWGEAPVFAPPRTGTAHRLDLYAIADDTQRLQQAIEAGVRTVQLRIKRPAQPDTTWKARLRETLARGIASARAAGAQCFINDHWDLASELGADAVHLGQEDLVDLGEDGRRQLLASGVALGISSHSVWELCRARALSARYIACGPVWPTTTKDMPWVPQGLDNLAWWCQHAGAPVVAIGGILEPAQARQAAACGADGICLVRALGDAPAQVLPAYAQALAEGRSSPATPAPAWPHPTLPVA